MLTIKEFQGEYRFLSNFWIEPDGSCVEREYQATKAISLRDRELILKAKTPGEAKRLGRQITIRPDWERKKEAVMLYLVRAKFQQEPLKTQLKNTVDAVLEEGNRWRDTFWGICPPGSDRGQNKLGKILMQVREELFDANY